MSLIERPFPVTVYMKPLPFFNIVVKSELIVQATSAKKAGMLANEIFKDSNYEYLKVSLGAPGRYVAWDKGDFADMTGEEC